MNQHVQSAPKGFATHLDGLRQNKKALFAVAGLAGGAASGLLGQTTGVIDGLFGSWVFAGAMDAACIAAAMVAAQSFYVSKKPPTWEALKPVIMLGLIVGAAGGLAALAFASAASGGNFARMVGWGISGAATGLAVCRRIPNLAAKTAIIAGAGGGVLGFVLADHGPGYTLGVAAAGAAIGLAVATAEQLVRKQWIQVTEYSDVLPVNGLGLAKQTNSYALTVGDRPISIGFARDMDVQLKTSGLSLKKLHANVVKRGDRFFLEAADQPDVEIVPGAPFRLQNCELVICG